MTAHAELKEYLTQKPGKAFVLDLTRRVYDWADKIPSDYIEYRVFEEFTVREATGQLTRKGLKKTDHYRYDAAIFVQPGRAALGQGQCFTVGLEIKGSKADLMGDKKMLHYLGWLDFFLIAVPEGLVDDALKKVEDLKNDDFTVNSIGVMAIDSGIIYRLPLRQQVSQENRIKVYEQVIYNSVWGELATSIHLKDIPVNSTSIHDPATSPMPPISSQNNGMLNKYSEKEPQYAINMADKKDTEEDVRQLQPLTEEERRQRREFIERRAAENKARKANLLEKASALSEDARQRLAGLSSTAQEVFWHLREEPSGANGISLCEELNLTERTMARAITELSREALVEREGSKKTGRYIVSELGKCDSCTGLCHKFSTCEIRER